MSIQEYIEQHNLSKKVEEVINAAVKAKAPEPISFMVSFRARLRFTHFFFYIYIFASCNLRACFFGVSGDMRMVKIDIGHHYQLCRHRHLRALHQLLTERTDELVSRTHTMGFRLRDWRYTN